MNVEWPEDIKAGGKNKENNGYTLCINIDYRFITGERLFTRSIVGREEYILSPISNLKLI